VLRDPAARFVQSLLVHERVAAAELTVVVVRGRVAARLTAEPIHRFRKVDEPERGHDREVYGHTEPDKPARPVRPRIDVAERAADPSEQVVGSTHLAKQDTTVTHAPVTERDVARVTG
jgi:hypothetical protein